MSALMLSFSICLLMLGGWRRSLVPVRIPRDVSGGLARMGFGVMKVLLSLGVTEIFWLCVNANPTTKTDWAVFMGMVSFAGLFYLALSGAADLFLGWIRLWGRRLPEVIQDPFWAVGMTSFWCRWSLPADPQKRTVRTALMNMVVFGCIVGAWGWGNGLQIGLSLLWVPVQAALILADSWLGRQVWWSVRVPKLVRGILTVGLFTLSTPLFYCASLSDAWQEWQCLFSPPAATLASAFLDTRLTTARSGWMMWAAVLTVLVLPGVPWWLEQGRQMKRGVKACGIGFLAVFALVLLGNVTPGLPESVKDVAHGAVRWLNPDGNAAVVTGTDGWLYPKRELDRMTQRRTSPGLTDEVLKLKAALKEQGIALLLLPVPDKLTLHPEPVMLAKYWNPTPPPGYRAEVERLRAAGVDVLDLTDKLWDERTRRPLYFHQDDAWTAEAMKELAVQTSRHIRKVYPQVVLDETPLVQAEFIERQDVGNLARALDGELAGRIWPAESTQMVGLRGLPGAGESPVLVVGGSLVRVYDDPALSFAPESETAAPAGWGTQLGALIGRSLDVADEAAAEVLTQRADGKKLVVWVVRAGVL